MTSKYSFFRRGVAVAALGILGATGTASADSTWDTGDVIVTAQTRAVKVDVAGIVVAVDKVSNPFVRVRVSEDQSIPVVSMTTHAAGENNCSAADNLSAGTLNRTVTVTPRAGGSATVYVKVGWTTTTFLGLSTTTVLEPFGPNGTTFSAPAYVDGVPVPVSICVA